MAAAAGDPVIDQGPFDCVVFQPTDVDVFDRFLTPYIEDHLDVQRSLMLRRNVYASAPHVFCTQDLVDSGYYPPNRVWLLVIRQPRHAGSLLADRSVPNLGEWKNFGSKEVAVVDGQRNLGTKQLWKFRYTHPTLPAAIRNQSTGWEMLEYVPSSLPNAPQAFKSRVAVKLSYTYEKDSIRIAGNGHLIPGGNNNGANGANNNGANGANNNGGGANNNNGGGANNNNGGGANNNNGGGANQGGNAQGGNAQADNAQNYNAGPGNFFNYAGNYYNGGHYGDHYDGGFFGNMFDE